MSDFIAVQYTIRMYWIVNHTSAVQLLATYKNVMRSGAGMTFFTVIHIYPNLSVDFKLNKHLNSNKLGQ